VKKNNKEWKMGREKIEETESYKYLGDIIMENGSLTKNLEERFGKVKQATSTVILCGGKVLKQIEVNNLIKLHETMTVPVILTNCETWVFTKAERENLDKMEIWAFKRILGLPKTTLTPGILFTTGSKSTSLQVDERQLIYLQRILCKSDDIWTKQTLLQLRKMNIGWAKQIQKKLDEYDLCISWEEIELKGERVWKNEARSAIDKKHREILLQKCFTHGTAKTKTKTMIDILQNVSYIIKPQKNI
jgi:TPP-dependent trihydroxycyclohexane-1,2-dione (THcHDO) dehydratase